MLRRCDEEPCHRDTPLGRVPADGGLTTDGLGDVDLKQLFSVPKDFWMKEVSNGILLNYFSILDGKCNCFAPKVVLVANVIKIRKKGMLCKLRNKMALIIVGILIA